MGCRKTKLDPLIQVPDRFHGWYTGDGLPYFIVRSRMERVYKQEKLPSGKMIRRTFEEDGSLIEESHGYGLLDIGIKYEFEAGVKVRETYFAKRRIVSRRTYEKARVAYADMPAADGTLEDWGADLLKAVAKERRRRRMEAERHTPDPGEARRQDDFCSAIMGEGKREDAVQWIQTRSHTLGERNWSSSKRLVTRLAKLGCVNVYACQIDVYEEGENTGHLVVELPGDTLARSKILNAIDRLASETGYGGPADDGQRYVYIKLD